MSTTTSTEIDRIYLQAMRANLRQDNLDYVRTMLGQLRTMAEVERCDALTYLIEMAYVESSDLLRKENAAQKARAVQDGSEGTCQKVA